MRAMAVTRLGGPDVLEWREMPEPQPGEHDLLIEVQCAGVNPVDFKVRRGAFAHGRQCPFILGCDVSGIVRGLGSRRRS